MPEHQIRLRGAWDWHGTVDEAPLVRRVDLPFAIGPGPDLPFRLVRQFGRPPVDPTRESVSLRLDRVPGLVGITLNGRDLSKSEIDPAGETLIPVDGTLLPKNALVLHVDPSGLDPDLRRDWGDVAILIRPRRDFDPSN